MSNIPNTPSFVNYNVRYRGSLKAVVSWRDTTQLPVKAFENFDGGGFNFYICEFETLEAANAFRKHFEIRGEKTLWGEDAGGGVHYLSESSPSDAAGKSHGDKIEQVGGEEEKAADDERPMEFRWNLQQKKSSQAAQNCTEKEALIQQVIASALKSLRPGEQPRPRRCFLNLRKKSRGENSSEGEK